MKKLLIILIGMLLLGQGGCGSEDCDKNIDKTPKPLLIRENACPLVYDIPVVIMTSGGFYNLIDEGIINIDSIEIKDEYGNLISFVKDSTEKGTALKLDWGSGINLCDSLVKYLSNSQKFEYQLTVSYGDSLQADTLDLSFVKKVFPMGECIKYYEDLFIEVKILSQGETYTVDNIIYYTKNNIIIIYRK